MVANKALFLHTHKLANGNLISHAHPFNKSSDSQPIKTHSHSQAEFQLISNLELLFLLIFLSILLQQHLKSQSFQKYLTQKKITYHLGLQKGRSPPII